MREECTFVNFMDGSVPYLDQLDAHQIARLVDRGVGRGAGDDLGLRDVALGPELIAVRLGREDDRLGTARREGATHT